MSIKESHVDTGLFVDGKKLLFPIKYSDELIETSPSDLATDMFVMSKKIEPYLFVGYFTNQKGESKWYFTNSRSHTEMVRAIETELGELINSKCGQFVLRHRPKNEEGFLLSELQLFAELDANQAKEMELIKILIEKIDPKRLDDEINIFRFDRTGREYLMHYEYYKNEKTLIDLLKNNS